MALLSGGLERHGAEKQAVFMARALREAGVEIRIYCFSRGDYYEGVLRQEGFDVQWAGRVRNPLLRVAVLAKRLWAFRPHIVQAALEHNNLHAALVARLLNCASLGALRSDLETCRQTMGSWTSYLFGAPTGIIVNSSRAERELRQSGLTKPDRIWLLPNAVDTADRNVGPAGQETRDGGGRVTAIFLARLIELKRLDVFLRALALARESEPALRGLIVGDGPERAPMQKLASDLGLLPEHVEFAGESFDPGQQLRQADFLVLCSEHEGSPNSVLEALAMGKPAIVTPAGDAPVVVQHGISGYVVDFGDVQGLAARMADLTRSPELRRTMGRAGRERIEASYSLDGLAGRLLDIYTQAASLRRSPLPYASAEVAKSSSALKTSEVVPVD